MKDETYRMHMEILTSQCAILAELPLEEMLEAVSRYEAFGCFVMNPIQWSQGLKNADQQKDLLSTAISLKNVVLKIRASAVKQGAR